MKKLTETVGDDSMSEPSQGRSAALRTFETAVGTIPLRTATSSAGAVLARSSARRFSSALLTLDQVSALLGILRRYSFAGKHKYAYASAGGLYPVQTYVLIRQTAKYGVSDLPAGGYYYHPIEHSLYVTSPNAPYDRNSHAPINRPVADQSALTIFLVVDLRAIVPVYASESLRMACIEAGLMTQLLEQTAAVLGVATCHIGYPANDSYRATFSLADAHVLLHTLLAGARD